MTDFLPVLDTITDELGPYNEVAEQSLIGSVLISPEFFRECSSVLSGPDDFHGHHWRHVWCAFAELDKASKPIDTLTVMDQLDKSQHNGTISALDLVDSISSVPVSKNAVTYAMVVAELAGKRRLLDHCSQTARMAHDNGTTLLESLERAKKSIDSIPVSHKQTANITDQLFGFTSEVEERMKSPSEVWGIPTGFSDIDKKTGGWQRTEFTLWAGQPGIGKSMILAQMGYLTATANLWVDYYSLEMENRQIIRRIISYMTGIQTNKMKSGYINNEEWDRIMRKSSELSLLKLRIIDEPVMSVAQIRADIYKKKQTTGADLIIVDYVGRVYDPEREPLQRIVNITNDLKTLARKEQVAVIGIHTMPKAGIESKMPDVQDASGAIENTHNADNVIFMRKHIPDDGQQANPNIVTVLFSKMRDSAGMPFMHFVKLLDRPGFGPVERDHNYSSSDSDWTDK